MYMSARGLVLRENRYKEADKILTILTAEEGKLSAKARAALRPRSKLSAGTQYLTYSEFNLFRNKGMWTVNEASSVEQFYKLRGDIVKFSLGSYIAELLEAVSDMDSPDGEVLSLGLNALHVLSEDKNSVALVKAAFELRLMCLTGYRPELNVCMNCGIETGERYHLDKTSGGALCEDCAPPYGMHGSDACKAMKYVVGAEAKRVFSFRLDEMAERELGRLCEDFALHHLDRSFGSLSYYRKVRASEN